MSTPILHTVDTLTRYIASCKTPEHLQTADNLINNFRMLYNNEPRFKVHLTQILCEYQWTRIHIDFNEPQTAVFSNYE